MYFLVLWLSAAPCVFVCFFHVNLLLIASVWWGTVNDVCGTVIICSNQHKCLCVVVAAVLLMKHWHRDVLLLLLLLLFFIIIRTKSFILKDLTGGGTGTCLTLRPPRCWPWWGCLLLCSSSSLGIPHWTQLCTDTHQTGTVWLGLTRISAVMFTGMRTESRGGSGVLDAAALRQQRRLKQAIQFLHKDSADLLPLDGLKKLGTSKQGVCLFDNRPLSCRTFNE